MLNRRQQPDECFDMNCPLAGRDRGFVLGSGNPRTAKIAILLERPASDEIAYNFKSGLVQIERSKGYADPVLPPDPREELARRKLLHPKLASSFLENGAPTVGATGQLLFRQLLGTVGLSRGDVFLENTLHCAAARPSEETYPTGDERKAAERCCEYWRRKGLAEFKPDTWLISFHPSGILRKGSVGLSSLYAAIQTYQRAKDFAEKGRRVIVLAGEKAVKAFTGKEMGVTKWWGHYESFSKS